MSHWRDSTVASDGTHHLLAGRPMYARRFLSVLKYHAPGFAPASDETGAFHIDADGQPAYSARFRRTFGFYCGRAAAIEMSGDWLHVHPDGTALSAARYRFCGNFQEERCVVRTEDGAFHIDERGQPVYPARYCYVGDYRDGYAVVQLRDGLHTHIDSAGTPLHQRWFLDLDVFHKGLARARDECGWHHVTAQGAPAYPARFAMVEPFYNGLARVETYEGALILIDERGEPVEVLRPARQSLLQDLSADLVGFWKTQTIAAAVDVGFFEALPGKSEEIAQRCGLTVAVLDRLARALAELDLVTNTNGALAATPRSELLRVDHPLTLAPAARLWAGEHYSAWSDLASSLRTGTSAMERRHGSSWFERISRDDDSVQLYQAALASYARHDYGALPGAIELSAHSEVIDAGGGSGVLLLGLLAAAPQLRGTLLERPEVVRLFHPSPELAGRCRAVSADLLLPWPASADAIVLARVLHDFDDDRACVLLRHAAAALQPGGRLYLVEMLLSEKGAQGGLLDLNMLVMTGGRERSQIDFAVLLERAGLRLREMRSLPSVSSLLVAERA